MLKPIIISYKLTTCQFLYLTNTYKPREILLKIRELKLLPESSQFVLLSSQGEVGRAYKELILNLIIFIFKSLHTQEY